MFQVLFNVSCFMQYFTLYSMFQVIFVIFQATSKSGFIFAIFQIRHNNSWIQHDKPSYRSHIFYKTMQFQTKVEQIKWMGPWPICLQAGRDI